jgi:hypothetical protein
VAKHIAVRARRARGLHDRFDGDASSTEAAQDGGHSGILIRGFPADGLQHTPVGSNRRDHVDLGNVDGDEQNVRAM